MWRLGVAGEYRDNETGNHVLRVGYFARELARRLGMEKDTCETLFLAAPLHDIGKIGIPDGILLKPGKLTDEEWVTMRRHAEYGARILRSRFVDPRALDRGQTAEEGLAPTNPLMEMAANIAEGHHERWDGTGYPKGLAGEDIPIEARITAVADVYDALRSVRPYKPAYPQEKVLRIMRESSGNHFDPGVYEAFVASLKNFAEISEHLEDTEEEVRKTPQERHA